MKFNQTFSALAFLYALSMCLSAYAQQDTISEQTQDDFSDGFQFRIPVEIYESDVLANEREANSDANRKSQIDSLAVQERLVEAAEASLGQQRLMSGLTVASIFAAFVGTFFVWRTLKQNKQLNTAQTRAYYVLKSTDIVRVDQKDQHGNAIPDQFKLFVRWGIMNSGSSPAFDACSSMHVRVGTLEDIEKVELKAPTSNAVYGPGMESTGEVLLDRIWCQTDIDVAFNNGQTLWIKGYIEYTDIFGDRWRSNVLARCSNFARFRNPCAPTTFTYHVDGNSFEHIGRATSIFSVTSPKSYVGSFFARLIP